MKTITIDLSSESTGFLLSLANAISADMELLVTDSESLDSADYERLFHSLRERLAQTYAEIFRREASIAEQVRFPQFNGRPLL